jgi:hypothetical protein
LKSLDGRLDNLERKFGIAVEPIRHDCAFYAELDAGSPSLPINFYAAPGKIPSTAKRGI